MSVRIWLGEDMDYPGKLSLVQLSIRLQVGACGIVREKPVTLTFVLLFQLDVPWRDREKESRNQAQVSITVFSHCTNHNAAVCRFGAEGALPVPKHRSSFRCVVVCDLGHLVHRRTECSNQ